MLDKNQLPTFTAWGSHTDSRGTLHFNNSYSFDEVKRIYFIEHSDVLVERGWRAHKIEQRWFVPVHGAFEIKVVEVDDFQNPNPKQPIIVFELNEMELGTLHIPKGYATSLRAISPNSKIMVMADSDFEDAKLDDYLFPNNYFKK